VILSRFAGIAKFQGTNDTRGFTISQINLIMDTVACLHLVSSKILIQVVDELDLFAAFSNWIRYEIDRLASDSSASPDDDKVEKEASIDHSKVLQYLQTAMTTSSLAMYFDDSVAEDKDNSWKNAEQGLPIYDLLDKQLQKQERGAPYLKTLPRVDLLCKLLAAQASTIFSQIAEAEKRNVLFGKVHEIGVAETTGPVAMRMSAVVSLQRPFSDLADTLRTPLYVGLMLLLCQKTSQILVCKLLSIVESKINCLFSSDYSSRTLHREWYQSSSKR
jgi:anaphase-promoting complex subunit 4